MDKLKQFVTEHKAEFDDYSLGKDNKMDLWDKISADLSVVESPKVIPLWRKFGFRVAASVLLFMGLAFSFFVLNKPLDENQIVNQELFEIDSHYKLLVNNQIKMIQNNANLSEKEKEDFLMIIDDLDEEYTHLKEDLKEDVNNQKIIEAIISNYRKKIQLMENLLKKSNIENQMNSDKTEGNYDEFIL